MNLEGMFFPESVAVIGASNREGKVGNAIMKSLKRKYSGRIYPVNVKEDNILGIDAFSSILDLEDEVNLAIIALPAKIVPKIVEECGEAGVGNLIIVSAGFSEAGRGDLEKKIKETVEDYEINLIGPNCLGVYNPYNELDTIFNPPERQDRPETGSVAFLSQSGAFGAATLDWFSEANIGLSKFVSYGNRVDIDEADLIDHLSNDEKTEFIIYYIEGVKDGRRFYEAARRSTKPILAVKSGRTEEGSSAATSHTASLAGKDKVYEGAFKQSNVIRAYDLREMFNIAKAFSFQPLPHGDNVAIVTNGGGAGVMATDELVDRGLNLARFTKKTKERFEHVVKEGIIPEHATLDNPVDIIGDAPSDRYERAIDIVLKDDNVDVVIVVLLFQSPAIEEDIVEKLDGLQGEKPIIAVAPGGRYTHKLTEKIEEKGIPVYQTPSEAVEAVWGLSRCCPET